MRSLLFSLLLIPIFADCQCSVSVQSSSPLCYFQSTGTATATATGQSPYTYSWAPGNQTTQTVSGLASGWYTVYVTDANNCSISTSFLMNVDPVHANIPIFTNNLPSACNACDGILNVNAGGGTPPYTFSWTPSAQTTQTATGLCSSLYTCYVTDSRGCNDSAVANFQIPCLRNSFVQLNCNCYGDCMGNASISGSTIGGVGPYTYTWLPSNTTGNSISNLCAGNYSVIATDANGCSSNNPFTIIQPTQLNNNITFTPPSCPTCCDGTANAGTTGGVTPYYWYWSTIPQQNTYTATGLCSGTYSVCVMDAAGCTSCDTFTVSYITDVPNQVQDNNLSIFPNPFSDLINIDLENEFAESSISIYDLTGRMIFSEKTYHFPEKISTIRFPSGVYLLQIRSGQNNFVRKIIKI